MSDLTKGNPEFTTAIRGYDRLQVDDYIEHLHSLVTYAEQRVREAESELEFKEAESELDFSRHANIGPRVSEILDLAVAESKELRERIKLRADTLFAKARREAEDIVEAAHAQAAETREQSQREREDVLAKLDAERQRARGEIIELQGRQAELLGNLRQLQEALGAAVYLIPDQSGAPAEEIDHDEATGESPQHRPADKRIFFPSGGESGQRSPAADELSEPIVAALGL
jgi:cell division septum initiation protein DivIVA